MVRGPQVVSSTMRRKEFPVGVRVIQIGIVVTEIEKTEKGSVFEKMW